MNSAAGVTRFVLTNFLLLALLFFPGMAIAQTQGCPVPQGWLYLDTGPACPTADDTVWVTLHGCFRDGCWTPLQIDSSHHDNTFIEVYASAFHHDGGLCEQMLICYNESVALQDLAVGPYEINITVTIDSDSGWVVGIYQCGTRLSVTSPHADINCDDKLDIVDLVILGNHLDGLLDITDACEEGTGDVDVNGVIEEDDYELLFDLISAGACAGP